MRMHQVLSVSPGKLKYWDIKCLCKREAGMLDFPQNQLKEIISGTTETICGHKSRINTVHSQTGLHDLHVEKQLRQDRRRELR